MLFALLVLEPFVSALAPFALALSPGCAFPLAPVVLTEGCRLMVPRLRLLVLGFLFPFPFPFGGAGAGGAAESAMARIKRELRDITVFLGFYGFFACFWTFCGGFDQYVLQRLEIRREFSLIVTKLQMQCQRQKNAGKKGSTLFHEQLESWWSLRPEGRWWQDGAAWMGVCGNDKFSSPCCTSGASLAASAMHRKRTRDWLRADGSRGTLNPPAQFASARTRQNRQGALGRFNCHLCVEH